MELRSDHVDALSRGATLLGSGGGGVVSAARLLLHHALSTKGPVQVVDMNDLPPDARVACVGAVGSPTVMLERLPGGTELANAVTRAQTHTGVRLDAVLPLEIGGVNGLLGPVAAAWTGLPLIDGDAMGRAFPSIDHTVLMGRVPAAPCVLADPSGSVLILDEVADDAIERIIRSVLPALGTWAAVCLHPGTAADYAEVVVRGSISRALRMGGEPIADAVDAVLFEGTVLEVRRTRSMAEIGGVASIAHAVDDGRTLRLDFANEYVAAFDDGVPLAAAPDIICVVDARTWEPVSVEHLSGQQRVRVVRISAPPEIRTHRPDLDLSAYGLAPVR